MKKPTNFIIDFRNYKDNLHTLTIILLTLLVTGAFLFIALFLVTDKHLNELGNARVTTVQSEAGALFASLDRLALELSLHSGARSSSDIFDPTFMSIDAFQKELPVECISQIQVYDSNKKIIKTCHGAYTRRFLENTLAEIGETVDGFEAALSQAVEPAWIVGRSEQAGLYCLVPVLPATPHDSQYILISLDLPSLVNYLEHFDDQSYHFISLGNFYISNFGSGRIRGSSLNSTLIKTLTGIRVRSFSLRDSVFTYTVAIPPTVFICRSSSYSSVFWDMRLFLFSGKSGISSGSENRTKKKSM